MNITTRQLGRYICLEIHDDLRLMSNISQVQERIEAEISRSNVSFALRFTPNSYLSTRSITVLVNCFEMIREHNGSLAIIDANEDILDVLGMIDIDKKICFCTEDALRETLPVEPIQSPSI